MGRQPLADALRRRGKRRARWYYREAYGPGCQSLRVYLSHALPVIKMNDRGLGNWRQTVLGFRFVLQSFVRGICRHHIWGRIN
jgi:hypothetical protein